jgi:CheY-like chemotaxis protein
LLVEDHEPTRLALTHLLTRRHYQVMTASSVAQARTLAEREQFDLVISDLGLPDGDGCMLMSDLRQSFGLKGIALTGYGMEQDLVRSKSAGFVVHLIKPVRVDALEKALAEVG